MKTIKELDEKIITVFDKTVKQINKVLPETFNILFGGGSAKIFYTDPENLLETGIDISISPVGKKVLNLNLLSGGEKSLVALSVLFAILKIKALPLVILDEAEAPLDPSNVEKFAKYIKTFTDKTQFMVVTHRSGTMEHCDILYGATMEEKGITKMVSVKIKDKN